MMHLLGNQIPVERFRAGSLLIQQRIPDLAQPVHLPFWKNHSVTNLPSILHSGILNAINYLSPHEKADPLLSWVSKFSTL